MLCVFTIAIFTFQIFYFFTLTHCQWRRVLLSFSFASQHSTLAFILATLASLPIKCIAYLLFPLSFLIFPTVLLLSTLIWFFS
jgi:hypothetical protein